MCQHEMETHDKLCVHGSNMNWFLILIINIGHVHVHTWICHDVMNKSCASSLTRVRKLHGR